MRSVLIMGWFRNSTGRCWSVKYKKADLGRLGRIGSYLGKGSGLARSTCPNVALVSNIGDEKAAFVEVAEEEGV